MAKCITVRMDSMRFMAQCNSSLTSTTYHIRNNLLYTFSMVVSWKIYTVCWHHIMWSGHKYQYEVEQY